MTLYHLNSCYCFLTQELDNVVLPLNSRDLGTKTCLESLTGAQWFWNHIYRLASYTSYKLFGHYKGKG